MEGEVEGEVEGEPEGEGEEEPGGCQSGKASFEWDGIRYNLGDLLLSGLSLLALAAFKRNGLGPRK